MATETVWSRFRQVATRHGDRPALLDPKPVTYRELLSRAENVSSLVSATDAATAPVVGISLGSGARAIAAMLGILRAGRAFTFINAQSDPARRSSVVAEFNLGLVIGQGESLKEIADRWIDVEIKAGVIREEGHSSPNAACCIVQTSGSAGRPLGIEISHAALLHAIDNYTEMARLSAQDRLTMLTHGTHFAAQSAIFGALLNGACLCPFDVRRHGFPGMADWLEDSKITVYQSPPSLFRAFFRQLRPKRRFPALRFIRLGGEPLLTSDLELFRNRFEPDVQLVNAFGISEAAGNVAYLRLNPDIQYPGPTLPVGRPSRGREIIFVGIDGRPADAGEIVVRGDFLATGYYRNEKLTSQKFRVSPDGKSREFWTGDLGHVSPEGWLMHAGRKDDQVKVRGQRVDLAALEKIIREQPGVSDVHVLFDRSREQLIAFIVADSPIKLPTLPISPRLVYLTELPLGPGGKIDRAGLLEHQVRSNTSAPRDAMEAAIAKIWSDVLAVPDIGVYDNFFELGGDSLKALKTCAALASKFRRKVSPGLLLSRPTVAQLAEYISPPKAKLAGWRGLLPGKQAESVVPLRLPKAQLHALRAPLFICPGGWGHENELIVFAGLLPYLPLNLSIYGLKQNFLHGSAKVSGSIESIAKNFLRELRQIQPKGPYFLLGECIASVIVLEIAHQLHAAGENVARIILLDPRRPRSQPMTKGESAKVAAKVRTYYRVLTEAKPRVCRDRVEIVSPDEPQIVRRQIESWEAFDPSRLYFTRVSGDHSSYIRDHRAETAQAIAQLVDSPPC